MHQHVPGSMGKEMVKTSRQGPAISIASLVSRFLCDLLHIVHFRMCSSSSLRLSEESKEPEESEEPEEVEEDLEDLHDSEMNYIPEI